jgi:HSP20 family protein
VPAEAKSNRLTEVNDQMALLMKPEPFTREVDRLFDAFFGGETQAASRRWVPPMDLVEAEDHFVLKADLPGLSEGDVSIEVQDGTLSISGERRAEHESSERGWYRIERSFGGFNRSLTLPEGVDPDSITAHFDRGVLALRIPKPEERKPRRVEIKAGDASANGDALTVEGTAQDT